MKSELSFLVELLLEHKLSKQTQKAVKDRIADVERGISAGPLQVASQPQRTFSVAPAPSNYNPASADQPESTRKLLEKYPDLMPKRGPSLAGEAPPSVAPTAMEAAAVTPQEPPVQGINTSPAAINALQQREAMIQEAISGGKKGSRSAIKTHGSL